jgi:CRP-like cAMP-binding protein
MLAAALIRKLEQFDRLSDAERQLLEQAAVRQRAVAKGEDLMREGDRPSESLFLITGFAARYNLLRKGKRQITALHIPGDFVDLHSFLVKRMDHGVMAVTPCTLGVVPHEALRAITETQPHLTRVLGVNIAVDAAIHRQWIVCIGRQSALGHRQFNELKAKCLHGSTDQKPTAMPVISAQAVKARSRDWR